MCAIVATGDGSVTLRSAVVVGEDGLGETYHSLRGAVGESMHVFVGAGFDFSLSRKIFEMGFGTGLNAWLTLLEAERMGVAVDYVAVEKYPVDMGVASSLRYGFVGVGEAVVGEVVAGGMEGAAAGGRDERFMALHAAPWGEWVRVTEGFRLLKIGGDVAELLSRESSFDDIFSAPQPPSGGAEDFFEVRRYAANDNFDTPIPHGRDKRASRKPEKTDLEGFDVVYWDAFAPDVQPELWTEGLFGRVFAVMAHGGVLVTYSAKGSVRRALAAAGFEVERLPGALGKRHMLRAVKA